MPTHPARARKLLKRSRAAVYRHYPFTIILKDREEGETQPITLKVDPGSRGTGVALLKLRGDAQLLLWAANLMHRGLQIKAALDKRRMHRRSRRSRKTRYRKPRFNNRARPAGWLTPSIKSRWRNVLAWAKKLMSYCPITAIEVESVRFDTQLLENPDISGVAYQRGTLHGYEVKEYLLERDGRKCAYCKAENTPLEIEHVIPKSRGGFLYMTQ
jgi:5-methylcytosine-specific restriction endonuclease McrA